MRMLIVAIGSYGDVLPLVGLALALKKRGHQVIFFTNAHFAELIQRTGLDFVAMGTPEDYQDIANHPDLWNPYKGWQLIGTRLVNSLKEAYDIVRSYVVYGETLMVSSTLGLTCRLIQETESIPHATIHLSPGVFHSAHEAPKAPGLFMPSWLPVFVKKGMWTILDHLFVDPVLKPRLNPFRNELGLAPVSRIFHDWLHSPDLVLCLFPEWFATRQPDWPSQTHMTGFPMYDNAQKSSLPSVIQQFLDIGAPPLVFTPGSANKQAPEFFTEAVKACSTSGHRGIFLTHYPEQLPPQLPENIRHFSYVPLSQLLPYCAALIHHGGIGTCAQALRAGIPQVIQPLNFDQFDNADRITRLGVGTSIPSRLFQAPHLAQKIKYLLSSESVKTHCTTLTRNFTNHHPLEDCSDLIESRLMQKHSHQSRHKIQGQEGKYI